MKSEKNTWPAAAGTLESIILKRWGAKVGGSVKGNGAGAESLKLLNQLFLRYISCVIRWYANANTNANWLSWRDERICYDLVD